MKHTSNRKGNNRVSELMRSLQVQKGHQRQRTIENVMKGIIIQL